MKKILIPVDGSDYSKKAVKKGAEVAKAFNSEVILLNVLDLKFAIPGQATVKFSSAFDVLMDKSRESSKKILEEAKELLKDAAKDVKTEIIEGDSSISIIKYIEKNDIDLIIMGSQGVSGGLKGLLIGSVTNRVLHNTHVPVLVVT
ncbi:universal stress protein [Alkalibacter saccharofermentans]|uniref:Universal stress protein n=1 Tax=Alkalibacter saccharofermentans DSM 14828 TaxID=1120975 RepID=A0A1M4YTL9_9FIRM|nr:universal stress protein [Alkalibacter saccharofermentans]SHF08802.1 Nucleotide-binding universal stress protein, UspA family [Alkalibacter saccharofermentans DSM 14828]